MIGFLISACACTVPVNLSNDPQEDRPYLDTWNHPTERSTKNVAACNGKVHVAWFNSGTWSHYGRIYYRRSLDGGVTWEPKVTITGPRDLWRELWIECTGDTVVIIYEVDNGGDVDIRYRVSEDGGTTWSSEYSPITSSTSYNQEGPSVALNGPVMHLAWADDRPVFLFPLYNVYYKRSTNLGATWTSDALQDLSDSPIIRRDPSNPSRIHLWFMTFNTTEKRAKYRRSLNGGNSWFSTVDMSGQDAGGPSPYDRPIGSMDVNTNVVYYMWVDERFGNKEVLYKRSLDGGGTWLGPSNLSGTPTKSWNPFVRAASTGEARLYWMDSLDGDWEVVCKITTDWGDNWSPLQRLTNNNAHDGAVSVDYDNGYWHIVWSSNESGNFEVYYAMDPCPIGNGDDDLGVSEGESRTSSGVRVMGREVILEGTGEYAVYSADGRLFRAGEIRGKTSVNLRRGVWFIRIGKRIHRVVIR